MVEARHEPRRPRLVEGEAESGTAPESPLRANELGDAVEPLLVEVVDWAKELIRREECGPRFHGSAACMIRRTARGQ